VVIGHGNLEEKGRLIDRPIHTPKPELREKTSSKAEVLGVKE